MNRSSFNPQPAATLPLARRASTLVLHGSAEPGKDKEELLRLRIKDVDLDRQQVMVRAGKGDWDRVTVPPESLVERLPAHRDRGHELYEEDRKARLPGVWMPEALERKYPKAGETCWSPERTFGRCRQGFHRESPML